MMLPQEKVILLFRQKSKIFRKRRSYNMSKMNVNGKSYDIPNGASVSINNGTVIVNGVDITGKLAKSKYTSINVTIEGDVNRIDCNGSVDVKGNTGNIDCGGNCSVGGNVSGSIDCGGSCNCGNVGGNIDAGGSVHCKK
jgi:hypothetical protein